MWKVTCGWGHVDGKGMGWCHVDGVGRGLGWDRAVMEWYGAGMGAGYVDGMGLGGDVAGMGEKTCLGVTCPNLPR